MMDTGFIDNFDLQGLIYLKEWNQTLILDENSFFEVQGEYIILLAREYNCHNGSYKGDLMPGIVKREQQLVDGKNHYIWKVILPFTKNLLYARFLNERDIQLVRFHDKHLDYKTVSLKEDGTLDYQDYAYLFEDMTVQANINSLSTIQTPMMETVMQRKKVFHAL